MRAAHGGRSLLRRLAVAAIALAGLAPGDGEAAPPAFLVSDINTQPGSALSYLDAWVVVDGIAYFQACRPTTGCELWKTDGSAEGTILVKDIWPGTTGSSPYDLTAVNGTILFAAYDPVHGQELWRSDGTTAGTLLVKDLSPGPAHSSPSALLNVNGTLYFRATDVANGTELWASDGTQAGTRLVKDIFPGAESSSPDNLTAVNGTLFFTANHPATGMELWRSDGTAPGTTLVKDIVAGTGSSNATGLVSMNGVVLFAADDGASGNELWKSDGTAAGTVRVKDIEPGPDSSYPSYQTSLGGTLYFAAQADGWSSLWKSDGTDAGTLLVKPGLPGDGPRYPQDLALVNGIPLLLGVRQLRRSAALEDGRDGRRNDPRQQLLPDRLSRRVHRRRRSPLLSRVRFYSHGQELWRSDGTRCGNLDGQGHLPRRARGVVESGTTAGARRQPALPGDEQLRGTLILEERRHRGGYAGGDRELAFGKLLDTVASHERRRVGVLPGQRRRELHPDLEERRYGCRNVADPQDHANGGQRIRISGRVDEHERDALLRGGRSRDWPRAVEERRDARRNRAGEGHLARELRAPIRPSS